MLPEADMIWMSLVVFMPALFAVALLIWPKGWEEAMRWTTLAGAGLTLGLSLVLFGMTLRLTDEKGLSSSPEAREKVLLTKRVEEAQAQELKIGARESG